MRVCILVTLALFGAAFAADTVFVSNAQVRTTLSSANGNVARTWLGGAGILNLATFIGLKGDISNPSQNQGAASASLAVVNSKGPASNNIDLLPYFVNWGYFTGEAKKNGNDYDVTATAVATSFRVLGYVTYTDANSNGVYDQGEETSLHTFTGGILNIANVEVNEAKDGKPWYTLVTHSGSDSKLRYVISKQDINSQGEFNKAENAKIDFWFKPTYETTDGPNARVALITSYAAAQASVKAGGNVQDDKQYRGGRGSFSFSSGGVTSELTWSPTASALAKDGTTINSVNLKSQVLSLDLSAGFTIKAGTSVNGDKKDDAFQVGVDSNVQYKKANLLLFSFDAEKPTELYWDPSVGQSGNAFTNAASLLVVLAAIAVSLF